MIQVLSTNDVSLVAKLHKKELPGFLSKLGVNFLEKFYHTSLKLPDIFTFVYKKDGKVVGFVSGVETTEGLLTKMIKKDPVGILGSIAISCLKSPSLFFEIVKTLTYPGFSHKDAELLSIAVDNAYQREGIGGKLFKETVKEFKKRGIKKFKVSIYDGMSANVFYPKMGCKFDTSFSFMGKLMKYYTKNI